MWSTNTLVTIGMAYCAATALSESRVATLIFNESRKFESLRNGRDVGLRTYARAMDWFAEHWPEGADRPAELTDWQAQRAVEGAAIEAAE